MKRNIHCSCSHDAVTLNYLPILVLVKVGSGIARGGVWAVQTPPPLRNVNFLLLITEQKQWLSVTEILKK